MINGVRPNVLLADEETRDVGSKTSKTVYKLKRTLGHYYCTCPVSSPLSSLLFLGVFLSGWNWKLMNV